MKNYVQSGNSLSVVAPYAVYSGGGVLVGALFGVAAVDALAGADLAVVTVGVYDLEKVAAEEWTVGAKIYWDDAAKSCTTEATGNTLVGTAVAASPAGRASGHVRLNGYAA